MTNWIPITERLPDEGDHVIVSIVEQRHNYMTLSVDACSFNDGAFEDEGVVAWCTLPDHCLLVTSLLDC